MAPKNGRGARRGARDASFEVFLAELTASFVNLEPERVDGSITDVLRSICDRLDLDAAVLWQWCDDNPDVLALTHYHRRFEGPPVPPDMDPKEWFPWALEKLLAGRNVRLARLEEAPPDARVDVASWAHFDLESVLALPLAAGEGPIAGVMSFHTRREGREWPDEIVRRLQLVAQVLANAVVRRNTELALRKSEERLYLAAESADIGMWELDVGSGVFWANPRGRELFGFDPQTEITMGLFLESVCLEDRERVASRVAATVESGDPLDIEYRIPNPGGGERWIRSRGRVQRAMTDRMHRVLGVSLDVTEHKRSELLQKDRLRFETLLADLMACFARALGDEVGPTIEQALGDVAGFFGCDRCGLVAIDDSPSAFVSHAWYDDGLEPIPPGLDLAPAYPWTMDELLAGRTVSFSSLDDLPDEAAVDRTTWIENGVVSSLLVPIDGEPGSRWMIGVESMNEARTWPSSFVPRLKLLGSVFLHAFEHKRADEELRRSYAEVEKLRRRLELENAYLRERVKPRLGGGRIVGDSPAILDVLSLIEQVAPTASTVLIQGETGTGKELVAQRIHELSPRADRPLVTVNCAALPSTLVESELFGREKGAFTGAVSREAGRFEIADGGTLLLDEVAELPLELQSKLLRVLEEGRFERVGSSRTMSTDVRVIAATNRDLEAEVQCGRFRRDLYFRLAVFPIVVPPLRERRDDVPLLVWAMVQALGPAMNKVVETIRQADMERLRQYDWPGNVRELRNVVERALILCNEPTLRVAPPVSSSSSIDGVTTLDEAQRRHILKAIEASGGRIGGDEGAAELLGMKPTTLRSRMQRLGIDPKALQHDIPSH